MFPHDALFFSSVLYVYSNLVSAGQSTIPLLCSLRGLWESAEDCFHLTKDLFLFVFPKCQIWEMHIEQLSW